MAHYRQIHTKIWKDGWFIKLSPDDKLLWIYLFSNERACLAGIYELPLCVISFETGLSEEYVIEALGRFAEANKAFYEDGMIWVVNLIKYNAHKLTNPKIRANIESSLDEIPDCPLKRSWVAHYNTLVGADEQMDMPSMSADKVSIGYLHEQEHEQEHEQITNDASASSNSPPPSLEEWLTTVRESSNRPATVRYMVSVIYPYLGEEELPAYGRIGKTAKRVGGWARLTQYVWTMAQHSPQGDLMNYIEVVHKSGGQGDKNGNRKGSGPTCLGTGEGGSEHNTPSPEELEELKKLVAEHQAKQRAKEVGVGV